MTIAQTIDTGILILIWMNIFIQAYDPDPSFDSKFKKDTPMIIYQTVLGSFSPYSGYKIRIDCMGQYRLERYQHLYYVHCECCWHGHVLPVDIVSNTTTHLSLNKYPVHRIEDNTFIHLPHLIYLDLSLCHIESVSTGAFNRLRNLKVLDLYGTWLGKLPAEEALPQGVFQPIAASLQSLVLSGIQYDSSYHSIHAGIKTLANLEEVTLDLVTGYDEIGPEFSHLTKLKRLKFKPGKKLHTPFYLPNDFLKPLSHVHLEGLWMSSFHGMLFGTNASLENLPKIKYIDLSDNPYLFSSKLENNSLDIFLKSISHSQILTMDLTNTGLTSFTPESDLYNLSSLYIGNNILANGPLLIPSSSMQKLKHIVMKYNQLGTVQFYKTLLYLLQKRHLQFLQMSYQKTSPYVFYPGGARTIFKCTNSNVNVVLKPDFIGCWCEFSDVSFHGGLIESAVYHCELDIPPNLTTVVFTYNNIDYLADATLGKITFISNNSLTLVNMSFSNIHYLPYPLLCSSGVIPQVHTIDFSHNHMTCINSQYFSNCIWDSIKVLNLSYNSFGIPSSRCGNIHTSSLAFLVGCSKLCIKTVKTPFLTVFPTLDGCNFASTQYFFTLLFLYFWYDSSS